MKTNPCPHLSSVHRRAHPQTHTLTHTHTHSLTQLFQLSILKACKKLLTLGLPELRLPLFSEPLFLCQLMSSRGCWAEPRSLGPRVAGDAQGSRRAWVYLSHSSLWEAAFKGAVSQAFMGAADPEHHGDSHGAFPMESTCPSTCRR